MLSAGLSIALFCIRAPRLVRAPGAPRPAWLRVLPHVVDTVLLASALCLAYALGWSGTRGWLPAKLGGVVAYIALGSVAVKRGPTLSVRRAAFIGALLAFAYAASVALSKSPYGFLSP
jgi:uncharacterized membrane protein SirB2